VGGGGEGQALLWRRHGATNVLDRAVVFFFSLQVTCLYMESSGFKYAYFDF